MGDSDRRITPPWIITHVREFIEPRRMLDVCTERDNPTQADAFYIAGALETVWSDVMFGGEHTWWCNPPFSEMMKWVDKAVQEARHGGEGLFLSRADVRTKWYAKLRNNCDARVNIARSVAFRKPVAGGGYEAMSGDFYGYAIWYFGPRRRRFERVFSSMGEVIHGLGVQEVGDV